MQSIFIPSGLFPTKPRSRQVVLFFEDTPILHFCISFVLSLLFHYIHRTFLLLQSFWIVHIMQTRKMAFSSSSSSMVRDDEEKPHVLAVDDSLVDRKIIERLLTSSSYKVTTAENGQKALELLGLVEGQYSKSTRESNINLIITDYCMPGMTGYDLLKRVKGSSNLKEIPVVIVSSENVPTRIKKCLEEGAQEFMLKPLKQSDVKKLGCHMTKVTESCSGRLWIGR